MVHTGKPKKSVQRRRKAVEQANQESKASTQTVQSSSSTVPATLSQDYDDYALSFLFSSYILLPRELEEKHGFMSCIPPVWAQMDARSPLKPAAKAVGFCLLEAWSGIQPNNASSLSRSQYQTGIEALRKHLQSSKPVSDDVLMASLMLDFFEGVQAFCSSKPNVGPHMSGTAALVGLREQSPASDTDSQEVLLGARSQVVGRALLNRSPLPPGISTGTNVTHGIPQTPGYNFDNLSIELVKLLERAAELATETIVPSPRVLETIQQAIDLDEKFQAWKASVPPDWGPFPVSNLECIPQSVRDAGLYQDRCNIYKSINNANLLNCCCCSRIKIQMAIRACLDYLNHERPDAASAMAEGLIQELADEVCACIPFNLGDRMMPSRVDDKTVQYPSLEGSPLPEDHWLAAAAVGGWCITARMSELLAPGIPLRDLQRQWIIGQLQRVKSIYVVQPYKAV
ncbi:MAG: hypothetical protein Q9160_006407 [Pyrenula sp. 1 TL-2023]